jgi:hypothetical protein
LCQKVHRSKFSQGRGGGKQKQEIPHTFLPQENFIINHVVGEATLLKEPSLSRPKQNIEQFLIHVIMVGLSNQSNSYAVSKKIIKLTIIIKFIC